MAQSDVPDYRAGKPAVLKEQANRQKDYKKATKTLDEAISRCDEIADHLEKSWTEVSGYFKQLEASHVRLAAYASNILAIRDKAVANFLKKPDPKILDKAFKSISALEKQVLAEIDNYNAVNNQRWLRSVEYSQLAGEVSKLP